MRGIKIEGWLHRDGEDIGELEFSNFIDSFTEYIEGKGLLFTALYTHCTEEDYCDGETSALKLACELIEDFTGTCPYDQMDWQGCSALLGDIDDCEDNSIACWVDYYRDLGQDIFKKVSK